MSWSMVQVQGFYTEETVTFKYKRPVKVWGCCMISWWHQVLILTQPYCFAV